MVIAFSAALFASALLLFLVQPMFAKMMLPLLGGAPSVWTTCMLFFQAGLLAGYAYAHVVTTRLSIRFQVAVHAAVVAAAVVVLPFTIPVIPQEGYVSRPTVWLLSALATTVGLPFFALSATAPLLQRWFSAVRHVFASDPYFLYAASNAGSLAALVLYPTLVEPLLSLGMQRRTWAFGYAFAGGLVLTCAAAAWRAIPRQVSTEPATSTSAGTSLVRRLRWLLLSFVPSGLMLAVTTYLTSDVAVVPLFWIVPLALYLLTFIVAFGGAPDTLWLIARRAFPLLLLPLLLFVLIEGGSLLIMNVSLHLLTFTVVALLCHHELALSRPPVAHLTEFYLWIAVGGVLGGMLNGIVAPHVFSTAAEYPLLLVVASAAMAGRDDFARVIARPRLLLRPALAAGIAWLALMIGDALQLDPRLVFPLLGIGALVCFSVSRDPARFAAGVALFVAVSALHTTRALGHLLEGDRTFFGIYRVAEDRQRGFVTLFHGTTVHGRQALGASAPDPLTYYHRESPIGRLLPGLKTRPASVGVVGLGVGSLAAYALPGDRWTFYEIDPAVERIARDARYFRFLERCSAACRVVIGDARLSLERSSELHDIIVLDAFSSDAIPVHLLTAEAVRVYLSRLRPSGVLAFHISNRHVDLLPPLARVAREHRLAALVQFDVRPDDDARGFQSSEWLLMSPNPSASLSETHKWTPILGDGRAAWTDDFSNIWTALRWR